MRTYLMNGAFNTRGLQNIGLIYALDPALREIYPDEKRLQKARRRHVRLYNSHPFWNPLLVGILISMESKAGKGLLPEAMIDKVKSTVVYTFSAIGDSFFGGSLLVSWALGTMIFWYSGLETLAVGLTVFCLVFLQIFKIYTFYRGFMQGVAFLNRVKNWDLINCGAAVKMFNAALMLFFISMLCPEGEGISGFVGISLGLICFTYLVFKLSVLREFLITAVMAAAVFLSVSLF